MLATNAFPLICDLPAAPSGEPAWTLQSGVASLKPRHSTSGGTLGENRYFTAAPVPQSPASRLPQQLHQTCGNRRQPAPTTAASNLWESPAASPHNSCIKPVGIAGSQLPTTAASNLWESPAASPYNSCIKPVGAGLPAMKSLRCIRPAPAPGTRIAGTHNQTLKSKLTYDWPFAPPANRIHPCL